jgi:cardiolipin synthase
VLFLLLIQFTTEFSEWLQIVFIIVATSTALSGADYMWLWIKKFILQESKK